MVQLQAAIVGEHTDGGVVFVRVQRPGQDMTVLIPKHWVISQQEGEPHDQSDHAGSDV
jgi:hypothetical protein